MRDAVLRGASLHRPFFQFIDFLFERRDVDFHFLRFLREPRREENERADEKIGSGGSAAEGGYEHAEDPLQEKPNKPCAGKTGLGI